MSGQGPTVPHKVRRNVSPQRIGPLKAVQPFILKPSPSSPVLNLAWQKSPVAENRLSPDRRSPSSPLLKVERPKAVRLSPASSSLRRTNSLDTIGPYLKGQWPVDVGGYHHSQQSGSFMLDKTTQTQEHLYYDTTERRAEKKKKKHRRSASFGHADTKFQLNSIRQKLQKTKDQGPKQRSSPVAGNHNALLQTAPAILMRSNVIHIPKPTLPRYQRNSVEGLNLEIEKLVQLTIEDDMARSEDSIPDGHRAPVPDGHRAQVPDGYRVPVPETRSVDTQTPSGHSDDRSSCSPLSPANRPHSISPATAIPIILSHLDTSRPSSTCDCSPNSARDKFDNSTGDGDGISPNGLKKTGSPKPNTIVREPPDGCEKVKVFDEDRNGKPPCIKEPLLFCPIKNCGEFVLKPSSRSAFCPLRR